MDVAAFDEWQGGWCPGGVYLYHEKGRQVGWRFQINRDTVEAKKLPRGVPRSKKFSFSAHGEDAKAAAEAYQWRIANDHGLFIKNQYHYCEDPNDGVPYIRCHIKDKDGNDHYLLCDVENLPLLEGHIWHIHRNGRNIYAQTNVETDGKVTTEYFHSLKCPHWPKIDHFSKIQKQNRNGLDNRSKHLRDGSEGVNASNCRLRSDNTSGVNGVCYAQKDKAWRVEVKTNGVRIRESFPGPKDTGHPSFHVARAWQKEQATAVGNTNGQGP